MIVNRPYGDPLKQASIFCLATAALVYLGYLIHAINVDRVLFADGANFFVKLLTTRDYSWLVADDPKHIRLFVNSINQFPVALALDLGIVDLRILKLLFGAGLFLTPLIFQFYCLHLSYRANDYRVFAFLIANLVTCAMPSQIFILNQSFTSLAIGWISIHYLFLDLKIKWWDWVVVTIVSILLFRSHESMTIWGGIIFVGSAAVIFFKNSENQDSDHHSIKKLFYCLIGVFGALQCAFALNWQFQHPLKQETREFLELLVLLNPSELWIGNTRISVAITMAISLLFLSQEIRDRALVGKRTIDFLTFTGIICLLGIVLFTGSAALFDFNLTNPGREFYYRILIPFGSSGWMLVAMAFILANKTLRGNAKNMLSIVFSFGVIATSMWQLSNSIQWSIFTNSVSEVMRTSSKSVVDPIEVQQYLAEIGREDIYKYRWNWAWPVLGMSLQEIGRVKKMYKPEIGFEQFFDPPNRLPFVIVSLDEEEGDELGIFKFDDFNLSRETDQ
ncbi:MAG: hypothetical protein KDD35_01230 [Bdellovibrionales bacterium]|nr:hypothetical protein [Bdellovibrionales bacterium]